MMAEALALVVARRGRTEMAIVLKVSTAPCTRHSVLVLVMLTRAD